MVVHRRAGGDQGKAELALEALLDNLHMEQSQKAHAETEAQRDGCLRGPRKRRIVDMELIEGVAQILVILVIDGEYAGIDHGFGLAVAG